jgi:2-hydroxychromene-2-carboxylate isomerase
MAAAPDDTFYFDLGSPLAYLAAERVLHTLPFACLWQPVLARDLPAGETFDGFRCRSDEEIFRLNVERRARSLGLQALRWPDPFPFDSSLAMRAATYATSIGRGVAFAQAAFRQAFAGGRSLAVADNVLIAAAACEMHPAAVLTAVELASVAHQLAEATAAAVRAGVTDVPAVRVGERVFHGERLLADAAAYAGEHGEHGPRGARTLANGPRGARALANGPRPGRAPSRPDAAPMGPAGGTQRRA